MSERRQPKAGDPVIFVDTRGNRHNALITAPWSELCVNLVYVSSDEKREDSWGRQTMKEGSVVHNQNQPAHGNYFIYPDEA